MCFKCFKKKKKTKACNRITNITNKQIAQYIVIDLEKMLEEERKSKESSSNVFTSKEDSIPTKKFTTKNTEGERIEFSHNFFQAPPSNLDPANVLNEKEMLKEEDIQIEYI